MCEVVGGGGPAINQNMTCFLILFPSGDYISPLDTRPRLMV